MRFTQADIDLLLKVWPRLRRCPTLSSDACRLEGPLFFSMAPAGLPQLDDTYFIRIDVPVGSTEIAPHVYEQGERIPRDVQHHVFDSGALCLGSPWTVRQKLGEPPSLVRFVDQCVVPFLYAATWREQGGKGYPFDDLAHGSVGLLEDYGSILGLTGSKSVAAALQALSSRRRVSNKLPCPCGCGRRLGSCPYRFRLDILRQGMTRKFFAALRRQINSVDTRTRGVQ